MLTATKLIHSMLVGKRHHDSGKEFVADVITAYAFCEYGISPKEMGDAVYVEEAEREKKTEE